jgi:hypothetical protein
MTHPTASGRPAEDEPLDETELALLERIQRLFETADPMPADLPERIRFSLTLHGLEYEVARLCAEEDQRMLTARGAEQSRTITFDSDSLTIMIRIDSNSDGTARMDGWLDPPQRCTIDLTTPGDTLLAVANEQGRFAFSRVPRGSAQLTVRAAQEAAGTVRAVITPTLTL